MSNLEVLGIIHSAMRRANDARVNDISLDGTGDDCELIITTDDGVDKQDWVIRASDITEAECPAQ